MDIIKTLSEEFKIATKYITNIINQFGDMYAQENGEILGIINEFKDIVK